MSDEDDIYTFRCKKKHAKAQAESAACLKGKAVPRRDDLSRASYYVALSLYGDPKTSAALKRAIQVQIMALLREADFSVFEANAAFLKDVSKVPHDIDAWLRRRWHDQGKHLGENGTPYRKKFGRAKGPRSAADKE